MLIVLVIHQWCLQPPFLFFLFFFFFYIRMGTFFEENGFSSLWSQENIKKSSLISDSKHQIFDSSSKKHLQYVVKNEQPKLFGDCPAVPFIKNYQIITSRFVHELRQWAINQEEHIVSSSSHMCHVSWLVLLWATSNQTTERENELGSLHVVLCLNLSQALLYVIFKSLLGGFTWSAVKVVTHFTIQTPWKVKSIVVIFLNTWAIKPQEEKQCNVCDLQMMLTVETQNNSRKEPIRCFRYLLTAYTH